MNHFRIAFGGAAILSLAMVVAFPRASEPIVVEAVDESRFDAAWRDTMKVVALRSAFAAEPAPPKAVTTERIVPDEPVEVAAAEPVAAPLARRRQVDRRDVCARHNLRKVIYGKKWRCRK